MSITQTMTTSFKVELMQGLHNFGPTSPNNFKLALYSSTASLNAATTAYTTSGEVSGAGYNPGGVSLVVSVSPTSGSSDGTVAYVSFYDANWTLATFTAAGGLIYNATNGLRSVVVLDFGGNKISAGGVFTVQFPAAGPTTSIVRIA
jgi:hypothetical protein